MLSLRQNLRLSLRGSSAAVLSLDFLSATSLDARITFTRGSSATRVNSSGVIVTASTNVARFDYDPVTLAAKGLLIEEARTNLLLNATIDGANLATQGVTVTAQAYTISFYGTGTITLSGAHTATVAGIGAYPNRKTLTFTPSAGTLTCTVTGTVQFAQVEAGSFATSFIPTAGATVTRSADVATMTGTNFSSWYNQSEGTFVASVTFGGDIVSSYALTARDAGLNNTVGFDVDGSGTYRLRVTDNSVNQALVGGVTPVVANTTYKMAGAYKTNDFAVSANGGAVVTDTLGTVPTNNTFFAIGSSSTAGATPINGHIRSIAYYNTRLPNAALQSLTA